MTIQTKILPNFFESSLRCIRHCWAGLGFRDFSSSTCLRMSASMRSLLSSATDPPQTNTGSAFVSCSRYLFLAEPREHRFTIKGTHIVPRAYVTGSDPLVAAEIQQRDDRCRRSGGIGAAVVLIQCGGLSQVMPVEVDSPSKITWDIRDDWEDVLHHFVESGRSDFKPISTTSRGSVSISSSSSTLILNSTRTRPSACITGDWRPLIVILVGLDETFGTGLSLVDSFSCSVPCYYLAALSPPFTGLDSTKIPYRFS